MLRSILAAGFAVLLPLSVAAAPAPDPDQQVKDIIDRAIAKQGGTANLERYRASTYSFTATYPSVSPSAVMSGTIQIQDSDKHVLKGKTVIAGETIDSTFYVVNGTKAWTSSNGIVQEENKANVAQFREILHADYLCNLKGLSEPGVKLASLGESNIGGKKAVGIKVSSPGFRDVCLYFDKASALLLERTLQYKEPSTDKLTVEKTSFSKYEDVSGRMVATRHVLSHDGVEIAISELTQITFAEKLPDDTFKKP